MTRKEQRKIERLERLLAAAEKSWSAYRETLYELVEVKMKLDAIQEIIRGE